MKLHGSGPANFFGPDLTVVLLRYRDVLCAEPEPEAAPEADEYSRAADWLRAAPLPERFRLGPGRTVVDAERWRSGTLCALAGRTDGAGGRMAEAALRDVCVVYQMLKEEAA